MTDQVTEDNADDLDLAFVREKRKMIINHYLDKGIDKISDVKEVAIVASLLNDMDRTAVAKKRIKTDDKKNNNSAAAIDLIAKIFTEHNVKDITPVTEIIRAEAPQLDIVVEDVEIIPGEMDVSPEPEDYDSFMKRIQSGD